MNSGLADLTYEIDLKPGEKLVLPDALLNAIGAGRWLVTVRPIQTSRPIRDHAAFLSSYAPEDEGLYDDYPTR